MQRSEPAVSAAALKALRALAKLTQPVTPITGWREGTWYLGSRDGYGARASTFGALQQAGYVRFRSGPMMGLRIEITESGRERITR